MPRGRNFFGPGFGWRGLYSYPSWGWGGNPFPFCRNFPWLPRWWWATPYASYYAATIPGYGAGGYYPGSYSAFSPWSGFYGPPASMASGQEADFLRDQARVLNQQLEEIKKRIEELEKTK
ncbi:MAG TPA: hypothetical protein ENG51_19855 [Deltaproteobacteria bacterium]|nr:DUF5320 domain-containing protein [bacterium]RKY79500.1 MAG: hypothetical protein DRQ12_03635 [candidate division KSB1 bacterium]HDM78691.1 hypothetical protein [Deltaproteobacteria bacterium]RKY81031.1 MAG: hypothetical protein DRQ00_00835 [candidate division KSB1 bacterium]RKY85163.1 MAG: hypothetical protein DRP98_03485 [candidate division KSB1 bacterium]